MKRILLFVVVLVAFFVPRVALAQSDCDSWLFGQLFCTTDQAKIQADVDTKSAEQMRMQQTELARINAQKDAAVQAANVDIERQRQQGLISVAQAQALADQYRAQVDAWQRTQQATIEQQYGTQRTAIESQTTLGVTAITQVGQTQRLSMQLGTISGAVVLILITLMVLGLAKLVRQRDAQQVIYLSGEQYPRLAERHNRIDATNYIVRKDEVNHG